MLRRSLVLLLAVPALAGCDGARVPVQAQAEPEPPSSAPKPHFAAARHRTAQPEGRWLTARITAPVRLRARPGGRKLERLTPRTEFGSRKVVSVVRRRDGWLKVLTPERPNRRPGWLPASRVRLGAVDVSLHVDRSERRLVVKRDGKAIRRMPVAVGRPGTETPLGRFAVTDELRTQRADSPYGCCALALSGHQPKLIPGWPGGDRLAIHATPQPESVGQPASLGCLRAHTRDMRTLMRLVSLGAPVFVSV